MGELCPDDALLERVRADMLAAGEYVSPSRLRRKLDRLKASGDCYQDLTYRDRRRRASVPADLAVGERVARGGDA